jgi:RNA polymerase primary sigma factor
MHAQLLALVARGEQSRCLELSELNEFFETVGLDESEVAAVIEEIESRDIELTDDCGREVAEHVTYANEDLVVATTDALQLFLREVRRYPLLTAAEEVDLGKRIERGDQNAKHRMINSNLRLVVSIARKPRRRSRSACARRLCAMLLQGCPMTSDRSCSFVTDSPTSTVRRRSSRS